MKKTLRILSALFGLALTLNGICLIIFANRNLGSCLTVVLGLIFFVPAVFIRFTASMLKYTLFKIIAVLGIIGFSALLLTTLFLIIYGNSDNVTYSEDYLVILGCGVRGTSPTQPLRDRLDTALDYLEHNQACTIIVSGGQGDGENISEAEAMKIYLTEKGIDENRIIEENRSTSTAENFKFSNKITDNGLATHSAAFVTNDFHIYRASSLARLQGLYLTHISAPTAWYNIFPSYLREYPAICKMLLLNK